MQSDTTAASIAEECIALARSVAGGNRQFGQRARWRRGSPASVPVTVRGYAHSGRILVETPDGTVLPVPVADLSPARRIDLRLAVGAACVAAVVALLHFST